MIGMPERIRRYLLARVVHTWTTVHAYLELDIERVFLIANIAHLFLLVHSERFPVP